MGAETVGHYNKTSPGAPFSSFLKKPIPPCICTAGQMFFYLVLAGLSYLVYTVVNRAISLRRNIALAKSWGLPYVVLRE
jgi:hypothetical protein